MWKTQSAESLQEEKGTNKTSCFYWRRDEELVHTEQRQRRWGVSNFTGAEALGGLVVFKEKKASSIIALIKDWLN